MCSMCLRYPGRVGEPRAAQTIPFLLGSRGAGRAGPPPGHPELGGMRLGPPFKRFSQTQTRMLEKRARVQWSSRFQTALLQQCFLDL